MKRCPKCNVEYLDNTLEFCLEDGSRLTLVGQTGSGVRTATAPGTRTAEETVLFTPGHVPNTLASTRHDEVETVQAKADSILPVPISQSKVLETAPIVIALAHNWWQWIYLEKEYVSSVMAFIFSANFLMWLLLLAGGVLVGLWSLKRSPNKTIAYASLIMLAVNLILFIVPRR